eukprot:maker-scaffold11_size778918-snap-gene-6.53 protein:Tk03694 transcript:maker-scaffold11_size778918-snap-gene-6.53-mRNA-1 annotation:"unnamed protein product"
MGDHPCLRLKPVTEWRRMGEIKKLALEPTPDPPGRPHLEGRQERKANAVIHSHGKFVVLASMIYKGCEFRVKDLEMIKGIYHPTENRPYRYDEELVVPIIENTCFEADLKGSMLEAMKRYPSSNAVIVRRHGIYVWGKTWQQCKSMAECYHYLCEMAVELERLGMNEFTSLESAPPPMPVTPKVAACQVKTDADADASMDSTPLKTENGSVAVEPVTPKAEVKTPEKKTPTPKKTPNTAGKAKLNGVKNGKVTKGSAQKKQGNVKGANKKSPGRAWAQGGPPQMVPGPWGPPPHPSMMGPMGPMMGPMGGPMGPMMGPPHPAMFGPGPGGPPVGPPRGGRGGGGGRGGPKKKQNGGTPKAEKGKSPNQRGGGRGRGRGRGGNNLGMSRSTIMNY